MIADQSAGRNGYDSAWNLKTNECADAVNVDFYQSKFGNKRPGMSPAPYSNFTFGLGGPFTGVVSALCRVVVGSVGTYVAIDDAATPVIGWLDLAGPSLTALTPIKDALPSSTWTITSTVVNGKLFVTYANSAGRLHVWDPTITAGGLRRTGLAASAAPTAANQGAGAYPAVLRYYRQRSIVQSSGVTIRRSEPSPSVAFTPSGANGAARVTQATVINEGETHWEIEASLDNVTFYRIATVAIATTFYDDSAATTSYNSGALSALTGIYTLQHSYQFVGGDQNRLLGLSIAGANSSRLEISAVVGSLNIGDEERVDTTTNYYLDFDEADSGQATGLAGPIDGSYLIFKERQVWQLTPTGNVGLPYRADAISKTVGAIEHYAITRGEDAAGNPALYFMGQRGVYMWTTGAGLVYIGKGIQDYIIGPNALINLKATKVKARAQYLPEKRQVFFAWAIGSDNETSVAALYDVETGGWSRIPSGDKAANIRCTMLFTQLPVQIDPTNADQKMYVGQAGSAGQIWMYVDTAVSDNGTPFKGYTVTRAFEPGGAGYAGEVGNCILLSKAAAGVTISNTPLPDFGAQSPTASSVSLTPTGSETLVQKTFEESALNNIQFMQYQIGDAVASTAAWNMDRLIVPIGSRGSISG